MVRGSKSRAHDKAKAREEVAEADEGVALRVGDLAPLLRFPFTGDTYLDFGRSGSTSGTSTY